MVAESGTSPGTGLTRAAQAGDFGAPPAVIHPDWPIPLRSMIAGLRSITAGANARAQWAAIRRTQAVTEGTLREAVHNYYGAMPVPAATSAPPRLGQSCAV